MIIVALAIATIVPAAFLYFLYTRDFYGTGSFGTVLLCFAWGIVAFALAYGVSILFYQVLMKQPGSADFLNSVEKLLRMNDSWVQLFAPITEEILKALILIYLVRRPNFTYFVDGAIYGFAAGMGFAIVENWSYVLGFGAGGMGVAIGRVLSTNLVHATGSAMVGIALGYSRFQRFRGGIALLLGGWLIGMSLHIGFNNLVTRVSSGLLLLYAAVVGFTGAGFIVWMIRRGLAEQKQWIEDELAEEGERVGVTASEAAVVNRLSEVDKLLEPIARQFGSEKAKQCERFLFVQARMGIKSKTLDKLTDEKMKRAVEADIQELRAEMDEARRSVGAYVMLYLRGIFPPDSSPIWGRLENAIQERIAARPTAGGTNLWATLGDRAAKAAAGDAGTAIENES